MAALLKANLYKAGLIRQIFKSLGAAIKSPHPIKK